MRRTKIICTIGPASDSVSKLTSMMKAGMDIARQNFSHGDHTSHRKLFRAIRKASKEAGKHVPIIGDLQGPKIRVGWLPEEGVKVKAGEEIVFSTKIDSYEDRIFPVTYKQLHKDVKKGERLLIDDGLIEAEVMGIQGQRVKVRIINGGLITSHKGMNFPDSHLSVSAITKKDKADAAFGAALGVDWIALSFVTDPKDVKALNRLIKKHTPQGQAPARVIVKIEKHEAIDRFDDILAVADGVMIARGDLGIEIDAEEVPVRQKEIIEKTRLVGKPVVVATQMLDSMIRNPRPTRAEVSDVANAVFDHTDAVMLSGESATGKYPVKAVRMMKKIVVEAEESPYDEPRDTFAPNRQKENPAAEGILTLARHDEVDGVIVAHGLVPWAEKVLKFHPEIPLFIATENDRLARQTALRWGAQTFVIRNQKEHTFVKRALTALRKDRKIKKGMRLAVLLGGSHGKGFDLITVE